MNYIQRTMENGEIKSERVISAEALVGLFAQIMVLKQCGEHIIFRREYTEDYRKLLRYEIIRTGDEKAVTTHFIPTDRKESRTLDLGQDSSIIVYKPTKNLEKGVYEYKVEIFADNEYLETEVFNSIKEIKEAFHLSPFAVVRLEDLDE